MKTLMVPRQAVVLSVLAVILCSLLFVVPLMSSAEGRKLGDIDADGEIGLDDLMSVRDHLLEITILTGDALLAADIDGSGEVELDDLMAIRDHVLEITLIPEVTVGTDSSTATTTTTTASTAVSSATTTTTTTTSTTAPTGGSTTLPLENKNDGWSPFV